MKDIVDFGAQIAVGLGGIAAFAYYACHLAENGLSPTSREKFIASLVTLRFAPSVRAAFQSFTFAADRTFGPKLISCRALLVSAIWTTCWIAAMYIFGMLLASDRVPVSLVLTTVFTYFRAEFIGVILIDFLCLTKSRLLIRWSLPQGLGLVTLCTAADLLLSAILFYYVISFVFSIAATYQGTDGYSFGTYFVRDTLHFWAHPIDGILAAAKWPIVVSKITSPTSFDLRLSSSTYFWSSMMTSVWIVLYLIGYLTMALAVRLDLIKSIVLPALNFPQKPFSAIGFLILLISVGVAVASILVFALMKLS